MDKGFILYLKSQGTKQKLTMHDMPAHNGVAECHNHTIMERVHALLHASGLLKSLWERGCTPCSMVDESHEHQGCRW